MAPTNLPPAGLDDLPFLDVESDSYTEDPAAYMRGRQAETDAAWLFRSQRGVEILRYREGQPLLSDRRVEVLRPGHYAELGAGPLMLEYLVEGKMTNMIGDRHLQLRRILGTAFRQALVDSQRSLYRDVANQLIDGFIDRHECDFVADFSHKFPIQALCPAIGVPVADIPIFERATLVLALTNEVPLHPVAQRIEDALQTLWDYTTDLVARRTHEPQGDYITSLAREKSDGNLTDRELVWGIVNLLFGAHDTTRFQTSSIVRGLIEADLWDTVGADPELVPAAVEEGMRYYPVIRMITRVVEAEDVVIGGVEMPVGTILRFNMTGATRDPERFETPEAFDVRRPAGARVAFGFGRHKCLGHTMARADMEEAVAALTARLRSPAFDGEITNSSAGALWGPDHMPITFEVVA